MKTGLTIQQMAQELLRQSKAKQDYLVNTGSLSLSVTSDAPQLRVTENGLDKITPLDIRQTAHRQLGTYLGIPQKYYELMRTDAPELLAYGYPTGGTEWHEGICSDSFSMGLEIVNIEGLEQQGLQICYLAPQEIAGQKNFKTRTIYWDCGVWRVCQ